MKNISIDSVSYELILTERQPAEGTSSWFVVDRRGPTRFFGSTGSALVAIGWGPARLAVVQGSCLGLSMNKCIVVEEKLPKGIGLGFMMSEYQPPVSLYWKQSRRDQLSGGPAGQVATRQR